MPVRRLRNHSDLVTELEVQCQLDFRTYNERNRVAILNHARRTTLLQIASLVPSPNCCGADAGARNLAPRPPH